MSFQNFGQQIPMPNQFRQIQEMFPQPQGSIYSISSPAELGNVPIGSTGVSAAVCFAEGLMYIKSFQNGAPVIMPYRITPYTREENISSAAATEKAQPAPSIEDRMGAIEKQLASLEQLLKSKGDKFDDLLPK